MLSPYPVLVHDTRNSFPGSHPTVGEGVSQRDRSAGDWKPSEGSLVENKRAVEAGESARESCLVNQWPKHLISPKLIQHCSKDWVPMARTKAKSKTQTELACVLRVENRGTHLQVALPVGHCKQSL